MTKKQQLEQVIKNAQVEISDINRDDKAQKLVDNVIILDTQSATVKSENGGKVYNIDYSLQTCNCPDHTFRNTRCKHIRAINIFLTEMIENEQCHY